jgi:hypothetical protein
MYILDLLEEFLLGAQPTNAPTDPNHELLNDEINYWELLGSHIGML